MIEPRIGKININIIQRNLIVGFLNLDREISKNAHIHKTAVKMINAIIKTIVIVIF